jgi:hypothetical protein
MEHIKLSRDIKSVINKYLDYSINNMKKIHNKNKYKPTLNNISLLDKMILTLQLGYSGFWSYGLHIEKIIRNELKKENLDNIIEIEKIFNMDGIIVKLIGFDGRICNIDYLGLHFRR